jgi:hypothetical protein
MKLFNDVVDFLISIKADTGKERRSLAEEEHVRVSKEALKEKDHQYIICNGEPVQIDWEHTITHQDNEGLTLPQNCYKKSKKQRGIKMLVSHWDVCLSSKSCFNVLKKRKLSVHFLIDNDGTIYQIMDTNDVGFHAGNRKVNNCSIGVEISNAFYPKYQPTYVKKGFGERPLMSNIQVHGRTLEDHLGFYPVQVEAFKALARSLNKHYNIPLETPMLNEDMKTTVDPQVRSGIFKGLVNHFHITSRKIDCASLNLYRIFK